jgi:hypothetical protein
MPLAVLIGLVVGPVALLFSLRVNAALVFLSLCLGNVLVQFTGADATSIVSGASTGANVTASTIKLGLLLAPAVLTTLFMIHTVKGKKRLPNLLPSLGTGLLTALLVVPLLTPALSSKIRALSEWTSTQGLQSAMVAAAAIVCLLFLLTSRPQHAGGKEGKRH